MEKDPNLFIRHILESIEIIETYKTNLSKEAFLNSVEKQDSLIRRIEIIGEAVKNLSSDFKENHPQIAWKKIAGMRDIVIHQYFGIDLNLTWEVLQKDIPKLKKALEKILQNGT